MEAKDYILQTRDWAIQRLKEEVGDAGISIQVDRYAANLNTEANLSAAVALSSRSPLVLFGPQSFTSVISSSSGSMREVTISFGCAVVASGNRKTADISEKAYPVMELVEWCLVGSSAPSSASMGYRVKDVTRSLTFGMIADDDAYQVWEGRFEVMLQVER